MFQYSNYCTNEQTERANKLGAPIRHVGSTSVLDNPTSEEMIGWLEDVGMFPCIMPANTSTMEYEVSMGLNAIGRFVGIKNAVMAAIDASLDLLEKRN